MTCLDTAQIQAVADGEASEGLRNHAMSCPRCAARVRDRERAMAAMRHLVAVDMAIPTRLADQVEGALATSERPGATRLRTVTATPRRHRAFWSAGIAVAATLIAVILIAPVIREPATVSAGEILAASATRLAQPVTSGVETLEYELVLDGVPRELVPDQADGAYRVRQVIDHDRRGHFRYTSYTPDGQDIDPARAKLEAELFRADLEYRQAYAQVKNLIRGQTTSSASNGEGVSAVRE